MTPAQATIIMRLHLLAKGLPYRVYHVWPNLHLYHTQHPITEGPLAKLPIDDTTFARMDETDVKNFLDFWIGMVT